VGFWGMLHGDVPDNKITLPWASGISLFFKGLLVIIYSLAVYGLFMALRADDTAETEQQYFNYTFVSVLLFVGGGILIGISNVFKARFTINSENEANYESSGAKLIGIFLKVAKHVNVASLDEIKEMESSRNNDIVGKGDE